MKLNRPWLSVFITLVLLLVGCKPSQKISGAWFGTLDTGHLKSRLVFHVKQHGGIYEATLDAIDQGRSNLPVTSVKVKASEVHFDLGAFAAVYDAKVNAAGTQMTGVFRQTGLNIPFTLKKTAQPPTIPPALQPASYAPRAGSAMQGYWQGAVSIGPVRTHLAFKIAEITKGRYRGELDSIDQGASGIPVTTVSYQPPVVHMDVAGVAGTFDGTVTHDGEITGSWKQGPNSLPLVLQRSAPPAIDAEKSK